jgi:hypothetical protein
MDTAPQEDAPHGPSHIAVIAAQAPNAIAMGAKNTSTATTSAPITRPRLICKRKYPRPLVKCQENAASISYVSCL